MLGKNINWNKIKVTVEIKNLPAAAKLTRGELKELKEILYKRTVKYLKDSPMFTW